MSLSLCLILLVGLHPQERSPLINPPIARNFTPQYQVEYDYISINGYHFNPKQGTPAIPEELRGETGYYLIQLKGPVFNDMKALIESYGVRLDEYIPYNTFIARLNPTQKSIIEGLSFVNWVGNYEPAYKISPLFEEIRDENKMILLLFNDADVDGVVNELKRMGCEVLDVELTENNKVVEIWAERSKIPELSHIPGIMWIEPWMETVLFNSNAQWVTQTWKQNSRRIWNKGIDGEGQVVTTSDTGILTSHNMVRDPSYPINNVGDYPNHRKIIAYKIPSGSSATFGDNANGSWHGTHTCGTICGDDSYVGGTEPDDGMPFKAKMYFEDIGDDWGGLSLPSNYDNLWLPPYNGNAGGAARSSSNSWGQTSGNSYTSTARMVDIFMWNHKDFLISFSAGNDGPGSGTVHPPATAKDCITAGACGNGSGANMMASFSSRGPTADNRIKPTVTAPGSNLRSSVGPNDDSYTLMSGTSMASPCIGGNMALVRDYFASGFYPTGVETPSNAWSYISAAMVKAILINGAKPDIQGSTIPDNNTGWGRICLDNVLYFANDVRQLAVWDDTVGVSTGQTKNFQVTVNNQSEPLKITLVWTDYYAASGANPAIVNNLNLRVTGPNATEYRGNQYSGGQSIPNPSSWDTRNVEENVRRDVPETGIWTIEVIGQNVPQGPQPFALVVSGGLGNLSDPVLHISGDLIEDPSPGGNGNGRIDPGETVYLTDTLVNSSAAGVTSCVGTLRESSPYITLLDSVGNFGDIPVGASGHNGSSRFRFSVSSTTPDGTLIPFVLHLTGSGGYTQDIEFELLVGLGGLQVIWGPKQLEIEPGDTHFIYGLGYNPNNDRLYVTNFYEKHIYMYTSDSNATYLGYINAPDTMGTDIKYCSYDNTLWFAGSNTKRVYKIDLSGNVLRQFNNPASTYPCGLAWLESSRLLYLSDRMTDNTSSYIYRTDTLGNWDLQITVPLYAVNATRCLALEPNNPDTSLLLIYTAFNSGGTLDSVGLYELDREFGDVIQRVLFPGWNARGVEYDPRDGNYWVTIAQGPDRSIVKIAGFYGITPGVNEQRLTSTRPISLSPGMPNPFTEQVKISYSLPARMKVRLALYDVTGRLVTTLVNGVEEPGVKTIIWDGKSDNGSLISNGVYFCYLETEDGSLVRKIVHTK